MNMQEQIEQAAEWVRNADGLVIMAGAGMGVDSGLPDFRGPEGFWAAYPALGKAGINFQEAASADRFLSEPMQSWGFYGHRLNLYRKTIPHRGFTILKQIAAAMPNGYFVYTSNVDGQFQKAGFDSLRVMECHGSIHHLQCVHSCSEGLVWKADDFQPLVDNDCCLLINSPPACPICGGIARPNILMFNDWHWIETRTELQEKRLNSWLSNVKRPVVIELGAGTDIPSVRRKSHSLKAPLIRINLRQAEVPSNAAVGLACGAQLALETIWQAMHSN